MAEQEPVLEPDVHEVLQEEPADDMTAIPVEVRCVEGPVRVQVLPDKGASTKTLTVTSSRAVRVLVADARRKSAVLIGTEAFRVAYTQAAATEDTAMALWPKDVPLVVSATVEVHVKAAAADSTVSVQTFRWAE